MFKKLRDKAKNKKGFTLVELIVVIVIILILAAVLVPTLLKYIDSANKANCKADAATILTQVQADYAASQASEDTGITEIGKISGVTISKADAAITGTSTCAAKTAQYSVTANDANGYSDVNGLVYNNGKYTATWAAGTWAVTKN